MTVTTLEHIHEEIKSRLHLGRLAIGWFTIIYVLKIYSQLLLLKITCTFKIYNFKNTINGFTVQKINT
jgi:hypothetical protein